MSGRAIGTLLGHHARRHFAALLPMAAGLALFELLLTRIAPAPDETSWIASMLAAAPPELLAVIGNDVAAGSPAGFLSIGYGHPFFFLILSAWSVRVSCGALAGEIGRGTMDLLAARPIARWVHIVAGALAVMAGLAVLTAAALAGTGVGLAVRPLGLSASHFLPVAAMAWLLFTAFGAAGLLVSATRREGGAAIGWLSGVIATSFVLEYLARLWKPMAALRPWSLFTYYNPQQIVKTGLGPLDIATLAGVTVTALVATAVVFGRRDL
jgi:ABC-type transport system involved in multi-copper enzyme maturation permease subunit